jgi:hypothetical protein
MNRIIYIVACLLVGDAVSHPASAQPNRPGEPPFPSSGRAGLGPGWVNPGNGPVQLQPVFF